MRSPFFSLYRSNSFIALLAIAIFTTASATAYPQTLDVVKKRGSVACGVSEGVLGFSAQSANHEWVGFDVDFCRALSAAIFNDTSKVKFLPVFLPDLISKEPLGPAVRQGDGQWLNIVKWTAFALVNAEELGVSSKNIDDAVRSNKPAVQRLVGKEGNYGERMGLTSDWAARIIRLVGNYGEIYDRNVGVKSVLGIPRGINEKWTAGGIMYAPPIR
jgi:hypothetical protein